MKGSNQQLILQGKHYTFKLQTFLGKIIPRLKFQPLQS